MKARTFAVSIVVAFACVDANGIDIPDVVVSSLNRMIDDAAAGKAVFYDIYSRDQKQAEPTRANTGLFFFRGKKVTSSRRFERETS